MTIFWYALGAVALMVVLYAAVNGKPQTLALLFGKPDRTPVRFETLELKASPNQFLVCPPRLCGSAQPHMEAPVFDLSVEELRERWLERISQQPRVRRLSADPSLEQYEFEQVSALIGFPDTITVRFLPIGEGRSTLAVYSRSHYGYSDFNVNEKRVRAWLELLGPART